MNNPVNLPGNPIDPWLGRLCGASGNSQTFDPGALAALRLNGLRRTLKLVLRNSPFYREYYANLPALVRSGILSGQWPECLEDIRLLPRMDSRALSGTDGEGWKKLICTSLDAIARMVSLQTSGTSGPSKRLAFSGPDMARTVEFFSVGLVVVARQGETLMTCLPGADRPCGVADMVIRSMTWLGWPELGRIRLGSQDIWPETQGYPIRAFSAQSPVGSGILPHPLAAGAAGDPRCTPELFLQDMETWQPSSLVMAPSQLARLVASREVMRAVNPSRGKGIQALLSSSEPLEAELLARIQDCWQCEVFEHYGLTESGYGGGVECAAHNGYHLRDGDILLEITDPASGQNLPVGEEGEIVLTTLSREAMPLIRYRTGDVACMLPGPCACGSPLPRLGKIRGRLESPESLRLLKKTVKGKYHG